MTRQKITLLLAALAGVVSLQSSAVADPINTEVQKLLQKGNQLAFIGDSITHGFSDPAVEKGDHVHGLFQLFLATRYPERDLWTVNLGRSGDNLGGLLKERMTEQDVFRELPGVVKKSDVAFIMYGMNDGGYVGYVNPEKPPTEESKQKRRDDYTSRLGAAVDQLLEKGMKVVVLSPTLYDETVNKTVKPSVGFNKELEIYTRLAREVAVSKNAHFIDLHTLMTAKNNEMQATNPKFSYTRDRVHPHSGGAAIALYAIVKAFELESGVFTVEIDAGGSNPVAGKTEYATITALKNEETALTWTALEENLPLPLNVKEYTYDRSFSHVPFAQEYNRQRLVVTGLKAGSYSLEIGGTPVAKFTAEELGKGVDLSTFESTPQYQDAWALRELLFRKQTLEIIKRDINSLRLNIVGHFKDRDPAAYADLTSQNWDEPDVDKILGYMDRAIAEKKEAGENTRGFFGTSGQTRRNLGKIRDYNTELAEIRKTIESLPESRAYAYRLAPSH